ncbi:MAG: ABC transporter ATP-binding protein [Nanoarchaeota archaeon]
MKKQTGKKEPALDAKKRGKEIIKLVGVTKHYYLGNEFVRAVDGIDISIHQGEFVAIVGPSGSGKSTAMNLVGALDLATEGEVYLDGINIKQLNESALASLRGKRIGFVFQMFNLIQTLTALENVMLPMIFQNIPLAQREEKAIHLLKKIGLEHRMHHLPNELSGGERQRVAIARALANDPEVILADEPTGNLDSKRGKEIVEMFTQLSQEGKTIILVTHDPEMAKYAHKIYTLKDGKIVN